MRLIDADALKDKVLKWMPSDPCGIAEKEHPIETDIVVSLIMEIEEAPTIEPKRGEWVESGFEEIKCSVCGSAWDYCDNDCERFNFCPNCGASMTEREGE